MSYLFTTHIINAAAQSCTNVTVHLVNGPLQSAGRVEAEWRSALMNCGGQCVIMDGIPMTPELCADNWDFLDQVLVFTVLSVKLR